jgi:ABC-type antimicrobial peptide transport system permease subunit
MLSLWLIAVANIAGLTLAQVHRRARELAIRAALGASRTRVVGAVVREGFLIAMIGAATGAGLAAWLVSVMPAVLATTPRINELTPRSMRCEGSDRSTAAGRLIRSRRRLLPSGRKMSERMVVAAASRSAAS